MLLITYSKLSSVVAKRKLLLCYWKPPLLNEDTACTPTSYVVLADGKIKSVKCIRLFGFEFSFIKVLAESSTAENSLPIKIHG